MLHDFSTYNGQSFLSGSADVYDNPSTGGHEVWVGVVHKLPNQLGLPPKIEGGTAFMGEFPTIAEAQQFARKLNSLPIVRGVIPTFYAC